MPVVSSHRGALPKPWRAAARRHVKKSPSQHKVPVDRALKPAVGRTDGGVALERPHAIFGTDRHLSIPNPVPFLAYQSPALDKEGSKFPSLVIAVEKKRIAIGEIASMTCSIMPVEWEPFRLSLLMDSAAFARSFPQDFSDRGALR